MKASELVALLNAEIEKYGDLEVRYHHASGCKTPLLVNTYTEDGHYPEPGYEAVEIFIH